MLNKPLLVEQSIITIPAELKERPQWIVWRYEPQEGREKPPKKPYNPNFKEREAKPNTPTTWGSFNKALARFNQGGFDGIGFVFSANDPYTGIDLDNAVNPETGELKDWAAKIVARFNSYTELSPSGTGVHIIIRGKLPTGRRSMPYEDGKIEAYDDRHYFTMTGLLLPGSPTGIEERQTELDSWYAETLGDPQIKQDNHSGGGTADLEDWELIAKAQAAGDGWKFVRLFHNGDWEGLGYPSQSEADLALCVMLAFWTGRDPIRMDRLFRQSALFRDKWDKKHASNGWTYGQMTIRKAIERCENVYDPKRFASSEAEVAAAGASNPKATDPVDPVAAAKEVLQGLDDLIATDIRAVWDPAVLEALGVLQAKDPAGYAQIKQALKAAKVPVGDLERAIKQRKKKRRYLRAAEPGEEHRVKTVFPDAPVPDGVLIPKGYGLTDDAVLKFQFAEDGEPDEPKILASTPILIAGEVVDGEEKTRLLRIAWKQFNKWETAVVEPETVLNARQVISLTNIIGAHMSSSTARGVADYLWAFYAVNKNRLPRQRVSSHLSWQGRNGEHGFLWGHFYIAPTGEMTEVREEFLDSPEAWEKDWIAFRPVSPGDAQIASGYHAMGTLEKWVQAVFPLGRYPRALLALYASCVPPLLNILGTPNFIVHWSARTTAGKTTTLRVAASVWGRPDERGESSAMGTWNSTKVWIERAGSVLNGLPLILDETKSAQNAKAVADVLYMVASGRGRGRGNLKGLAAIRTWHTVLLSSGEAKITSYTQDGGTRARTLEIVGLPFGDNAQNVVSEISAGVALNYGHAGPLLVRWLLRNRDKWQALRDKYAEAVQWYAGHRSGVVHRLAQPAAAIATAAACLHLALKDAGHPLPWEYKDPLAALWDDIAYDAEEAAPEIRAMRDVASWAYSHVDAFIGRGDRMPPGGWAGVWEDTDDWDAIAFYPTALKKVLLDEGYEPDAILQGWKERGWIQTDGDRSSRYTKRMLIEINARKERQRFVVIRREAIDMAEENFK